MARKVLSIRCPGENCSEAYSEKTLLKLVRPRLAEKYYLFKREELVKGDQLIRWCPRRCGRFSRPKEQSTQELLKCQCGAEFCSLCSLPWHHPQACLPVLLHCYSLKSHRPRTSTLNKSWTGTLSKDALNAVFTSKKL
jgi:hypothetical protein